MGAFSWQWTTKQLVPSFEMAVNGEKADLELAGSIVVSATRTTWTTRAVPAAFLRCLPPAENGGTQTAALRRENPKVTTC